MFQGELIPQKSDSRSTFFTQPHRQPMLFGTRGLLALSNKK
jgi:hypothetical protein